MSPARSSRPSRDRRPSPGSGADRPVADRLREIRDWIARGGDDDPHRLVERLDDDESVLRQAAAWGLGHLKVHRSRPALERALRDSEAEVRRSAAGALGALGDARSRVLLEQALQDPSARVREQAAWALWAIADDRSEQALIACMDDDDPVVRWSAAVALGRLGCPGCVEALRLARGDPNDRVRREALLALAHLGPPDLGALLRPFLTDPAVRVRIAAAVGLGERRVREAVPWLLDRLPKETDARVLPSLLVALGRIGDPAAIPALLGFTSHRTSWARVCAFHALGDLRAPDAAGPAREHLIDPVWSVRGAAAECLGGVGVPADSTVLLPLLDDRQMWPRRGAVYALGRLGAVDALPRIRAHLGDPEPEVRLAAVWALGHLGDTESRDGLFQLLEKPDSRVGERITFAEGDGAISLQSDAHDRIFDAVVQALGRLYQARPDPVIARSLVRARRRLPAAELHRPSRLPAPEVHRGTDPPTLAELFEIRRPSPPRKRP